jgi:hypothetical protein
MLLKVPIYAYTQQLYSSHEIVKALRENMYFKRLLGNQQPDFRTINRFRSGLVKDLIEELFTSVPELLIELGYVKLENYFLDGTKLGANATKYSWLWAKGTRQYKQKLQKKVKRLIVQIEEKNGAENAAHGEWDLEEVRLETPELSQKLEHKIQELNQRLKAQTDKPQKSLLEEPEPGEKTIKVKKKRGHLAKTKVQKKHAALKMLEGDCLPRQKKYENQK